MVFTPPAPSLEDLQQRITDASRRKAHLELINRMLTRLTDVSGLEDMIRHILNTLMETIGAANIALYHLIGDQFIYNDIYGNNRIVETLEDEYLLQALESLTPLRIPTTTNLGLPTGPTGLGATETWLFPLLARDRVIGIVVMEDMQLLDEQIMREIQPFFTYASLMLDNEITNYAQLAETHKLLQDSETLYRTLFEQSPDGIQLTDPVTTKAVYFNTTAHQQLGYSREEFAGLTVADYEIIDSPEMIYERIDALLQSGSTTFESVYRTKQGTHINTFVSLRTIDIFDQHLILASVRNITARKALEARQLEMERRLLHAQKLESLGVLAGGIAHDFNNLLAAIMGNLDLSLLQLPVATPERTLIERAFQACHRAADLTRQMLAYSGKGAFELREVDLGDLVRTNAELLRTSIPRTISMLVETAGELPPIKADPGQIQQIVMNLITNAAEAMGQNPGLIAISTGAADYDTATLDQSRLEEKSAAGRFVWLEVSDNGCGMDEQTMQRLFEPFFTTKFTGRGLGMAAVLGIVRAHQGAIFLESAVGCGTRFRVLFPAITHQQSVATESHPEATVPGNGLVLVADDEEMVRNFCATCIERLGYNVLPAADGQEALELFMAHKDEIDLAILDLTMPHMDGVATFHELRRLRPGIKVIISSGYGEQNITEQFPTEKPNAFIQKPFAVKTLQELIGKISG